jgi:Mg2+ and Co2+ transporter CorA
MGASVGSIWEPPVVSTHTQYCILPARDSQHQIPPTSATVLFKHAVRRSLLSASPLMPEDLSGSWLSALIYMDAIVLADSLDDLVSEWQDLRKKLSADDEMKHSKKLEKVSQSSEDIYTSLQTSANQVAAFRKSYPAARYSDFGEAYHFLSRLLGDAKPVTAEIKDEINRQQEDLNLKVSRKALEESRSAISREYLTSALGNCSHITNTRSSVVTILAFIFIPINTASSIFGMNVKEIGDSASIWAFVIIACALTMCSGFGWFLWRAPWKQWGNSLRWTLKIPVSQKERRKHDMELCAQYT